MPSPIENFVIKAIVRSPLHPLLGSSFAVITVKGTKTGRLYSTPINVAPQDEGYTVVSLRNRTWWRNLRRGQIARLRLAGRTLPVTATIFEDPTQVVEELACYFQKYPAYAKYFGVKRSDDGQPSNVDLQTAAQDRVIVQLTPSPPAGRTS